MLVLQQQPNESADQFAARQKRVHDCFTTSMVIHATNDEQMHGSNEAFLDEINLPDNMWSILFDTGTTPLAVLGFTPACKIVLFLDFTKPPIFDFNRLPTLPTPNESNFETLADNHSWFAASKSTLSAFFEERKTNHNWLHRAAMYDILLLFLGIPLALWVDYRIGALLVRFSQLPAIITTAIYIYSFLMSLNIFRMFFSYSRWVFPKVELETQIGSSPLRHRGAWAAISIPLLAAFLYDVLRSIFMN